ncbi:MAG: ABC transporter permease [Planctomycetes bacterium]|nr:ABC transporter permease [Planctomycetota bacterium]
MLVFCLIRLLPGDPASVAQTGVEDPKAQQILAEKIRRQFRLDRPIPVQYGMWLADVARGDFGNSYQDGRPVVGKIIERLPATVSLAALSILLGLSIAIPLGVMQAARQNSWFDRGSGTFFYVLYAVPSYVAAVVLIYWVGVKWDLLPFRGMTSDGFGQMSFLGKAEDLALHFTLITFCYTYGSIAVDSRFMRGNLLEVMRQDFIRTARAKGLPEGRVIFKHALRNSLIPILTRFALLLPALISGSVILEVIFNWPGLGRLFFEGIMTRDYPLMMAGIMVSSSLVLVGILLADLAYAWADPRISYA